MPFKDLEKILYKDSSSIKEILEGFNSTATLTEGQGFAIIIDDLGKCVGVVSDGDIRRGLLEKNSLDSSIKNVMNKSFSFVNDKDSTHRILREFDKGRTNLPVLDQNNHPIDLYRYSKFGASDHFEKRIIRARVPVRVSYSGGGTDMTKLMNRVPSAVLSSTINKYCTASVIIRDDKKVHITSKDLEINYISDSIDKIEYGDDLDLIKAAVKIMKPNFGFDLETFAEYEPGTGLGGSSAVVVAVLGALNYFRNENQLDLYQIADLAYQVERIDMKIQGGWQDQYATAFGGFNWIEFRKNEVLVNPLKLNRNTQLELEYNLMLFRLGGNRSSSDLQEELLKKVDENKNQIIFEKVRKLADKMKDSLLKGHVKSFADYLHEAWVLKKKMNDCVSNKFVEECYNAARDIGALGGKLLGAGGSGYLLIYSSPLYQKKIKNKLEKIGATQEPFKFCTEGLEVWSTKK